MLYIGSTFFIIIIYLFIFYVWLVKENIDQKLCIFNYCEKKDSSPARLILAPKYN